MKPIEQLSPAISISGDVGPDDLAAIAALGFRTVINNRPDGEAIDQPTSAAIEKAAHKLGLTYRHIPIVPGDFPAEAVVEFGAVLSACEGPVLAFCKSGMRSKTIYTLATHGG